MIHGHITPEGKMVLGADTPTEQFALVCWQAGWQQPDGLRSVNSIPYSILEIVVNKESPRG